MGRTCIKKHGIGLLSNYEIMRLKQPRVAHSTFTMYNVRIL